MPGRPSEALDAATAPNLDQEARPPPRRAARGRERAARRCASPPDLGQFAPVADARHADEEPRVKAITRRRRERTLARRDRFGLRRLKNLRDLRESRDRYDAER